MYHQRRRTYVCVSKWTEAVMKQACELQKEDDFMQQEPVREAINLWYEIERDKREKEKERKCQPKGKINCSTYRSFKTSNAQIERIWRAEERKKEWQREREKERSIDGLSSSTDISCRLSTDFDKNLIMKNSDFEARDSWARQMYRPLLLMLNYWLGLNYPLQMIRNNGPFNLQ